MEYTPAPDTQILATYLTRTFFREVEGGIGQHFISDHVFRNVTSFKLPVENPRTLTLTPADPASIVVPLRQFCGFVTVMDSLEAVKDEAEVKTVMLAHEVIGAYVNAVRHAVEDYGHDCGVLHLRGNENLRFIAHNWAPSVADPARVIGSSLAYNFKFVACKNEHIPARKITVEDLKKFRLPQQDGDFEVLAQEINHFFSAHPADT